jgi:uncharacterized membrane protein YgdD (TMEM256/DUF423 family)
MPAPTVVLRIGCLTAGLAVCLGALGDYAYEQRLHDHNMTSVYARAVHYQFYHSLPHFAIAWLLALPAAASTPAVWSRTLQISSGLFTVGTLLFSVRPLLLSATAAPPSPFCRAQAIPTLHTACYP